MASKLKKSSYAGGTENKGLPTLQARKKRGDMIMTHQ